MQEKTADKIRGYIFTLRSAHVILFFIKQTVSLKYCANPVESCRNSGPVSVTPSLICSNSEFVRGIVIRFGACAVSEGADGFISVAELQKNIFKISFSCTTAVALCEMD